MSHTQQQSTIGLAPSVSPTRTSDAAEFPALSHDFADRLPELAVEWEPMRPDDPRPLVVSRELAESLGLDPDTLTSERGVRFLLGNDLPKGSRPVAQRYAGHQFGAFVPQLGDGRAVLLGELRAPDGRLVDLHLKGSGRTPFARADGFAAVGPMLREFLVSEAMHALGIPTTRSLAVIATGRWVQRDELHPGAVLVRTAASHLRVGSFQYALARGDRDLLRRIADTAIARHDPDLADAAEPYLELLRAVVQRYARLTAQWMLVGFVHGVMNTDNVTISGETIDYGPCAFIDAYDPAAVFSSIDHAGRYAYGNQPQLALWNLTRFGETLLPLIQGSGDVDDATIGRAREVLEEFSPTYESAWLSGMRAKLGLSAAVPDETVSELAASMLSELERRRVDYTGFFGALTHAARGDEAPVRSLCGDEPDHTATGDGDSWPGGWFERWRDLRPDGERMSRTNPVVIPRGHVTDEALDAAERGDMAPFERLLDAVTHPFDERPDAPEFTRPAPRELGRYRTTCGT